MKIKILIVLALLAGCSKEKNNVVYQSGPYICEEYGGENNNLLRCINMSDMSEVKRIRNATNIIEIEVGK